MKKQSALLKRIIIIVILLVFFSGIFVFCSVEIVNQATFYPRSGTVVDIKRLPPSIQHHTIPTADGEQLSAFYIRNSEADKTMIYFHGNAGNASERLPDAIDMATLGSNVLLLDYRGYGLSSGSPSEEGIYLDGRAALNFLIQEKDLDSTAAFLFGRSLGSAVAVDIAQEYPFAGMILITPISSGRDVAQNAGLGSAASVMGNPFNNTKKIAGFTAPILLIHGDSDEVLPMEMSQKLVEAAQSKTHLVILPGAGHNTIIQVNKANFYAPIQAFCDSILADRSLD